MQYFDQYNKTNNKSFEENYLYEVIINKNTYLADYTLNNNNYIRMLNKNY